MNINKCGSGMIVWIVILGLSVASILVGTEYRISDPDLSGFLICSGSVCFVLVLISGICHRVWEL